MHSADHSVPHTFFPLLQEDFKPYARAMQGFSYRAERPDAATFVDQKWGYTGVSPGDWVELEVSTADGTGDGAGGGDDKATVFLGYLRRCGSGMGALADRYCWLRRPAPAVDCIQPRLPGELVQPGKRVRPTKSAWARHARHSAPQTKPCGT